MRATFLLAIGLVFLCLALMGMVSLPLLARPEVRHIATENIPGSTLQPPIQTNTPTGTEAPTFTATMSPTLRPTNTLTVTSTLTVTPTFQADHTQTITPGGPTVTEGVPTTSESSCDRAELIADVTVPDGTIFTPSATFTKTWRLRNIGTCEWSTSYQVVFVRGEQMGAPASAAFPQTVAVGETVDVSINMTAPSVDGSYRGYWMFKNSRGALFGIGPEADISWWVDIRVAGPTVTPGGLTPTPILSSITPQPTLTVIDTLPQLVEAEWPSRLKVRQSGTIRISLIRGGNNYTPTVEITSSSNTAVVVTVIPIDTPNAPDGTEYQAYAVAHIAGAAFNISLASPETQWLEQSRVDWIWNIASDNVGLQGIDVFIEIEWKPVGNNAESVRSQIWRSHLEIEVFQPIISTGQVSAFSLFSAFIGSGLSIPWIYEMISKRKRKPKKQRAVRQNK